MENENQSQFENFENQLTASAIGFLKESVKWCKFMSIVGFVGVGLMILVAVSMFIGFNALESMSETSKFPFPTSLISVVYLIFAALYFFPVYYLYQYATKTSLALQSRNQQLLTDGLENLKSHHKFLGIFTLIIVSIYGLIFVGAILGGLMS